MHKIVIIGSNGAGKTTLADSLSKQLDIKVYHLDRLFWGPGWKGVDRETRIDILEKLAPEKQWIIEGTYLKSSGPRLQNADTIIFLDTPGYICILRVLKRYREHSGLSPRDIPDGCAVNFSLPRLFKVSMFPFRERRELQKMLHPFPEKVIRLHSPKQVRDFLIQPEAYAESLKKAGDIHPGYSEIAIKILKIVSLSYLALWMFKEPAQRAKHSIIKLFPSITKNRLPQASDTLKIDEGNAYYSTADISPEVDAPLEEAYTLG